jgi:hypothetical protein
MSVEDITRTEPTLGEIMRRLDEVSIEVKAIPLRINDDYVRRDLYIESTKRANDARDALTLRVLQLESRSEWMIRTVGGLIIAAVLGLIFITRH